MFDHVTIRVSDRAASERFYRTVLAALDREATPGFQSWPEWEDFSLAPATPESPVTRRLHIGFAAPSRAHVDAFWRAGVEAGHRSDGEPGPRPEYREDYYGAFLLDPDGNSAEAVHHGATRTHEVIDHLWIRVADVAASRRFYETIAPHCGISLGADRPDLVRFRDETGSFSLVAGAAPTENVHLAFGGDRAAVDAFHRAALGAGYRDNGTPGERPHYHDGYYAAFVLDPDGNNVEVVDHGRD